MYVSIVYTYADIIQQEPEYIYIHKCKYIYVRIYKHILWADLFIYRYNSWVLFT